MAGGEGHLAPELADSDTKRIREDVSRYGTDNGVIVAYKSFWSEISDCCSN